LRVLALGCVLAVLLGASDLSNAWRGATSAPAGFMSLAPAFASPGVVVHVAGGGFQPAESVDVRVTDPIGTALTVGHALADGQGRVGLDLSPTDYATNGDNLVTLAGSASGVTASTPITLVG
jgi:hypothetical protein